MLVSISTAVIALSALTTAIPRTKILEAHDIIGPSAAYQIYKANPDQTFSLGGSSDGSGTKSTPTSTIFSIPISIPVPSTSSSSLTPSNTFPIVASLSSPSPSTLLAVRQFISSASAPSIPTGSSTFSASSPSVTKDGGLAFDFRVSQDAGNTNDVDLVVSFTNLPCHDSPGPFSFEFNFVPNAGYSSSGEGRISVFKINGDLGAGPTYNSVSAATGNLLGTFELPTGSKAGQPKLIFIDQMGCEPTINLRFGIAQYSSAAGAVAYFNRNGMGLRERSG